MTYFRKILRFAIPYRKFGVLNIFFNVLYALFSALSFAAPIPMLDVLFQQTEVITEKPSYQGIGQLEGYVKGWLYYEVNSVAGEDKVQANICKTLKLKFQDLLMDGRLLREAQERANLASKVVQSEDAERQIQRRNQWFKETADDAELEMDDLLVEEGDGASSRDRNTIRQAAAARQRLTSLLKQPLQTQRFGKFLSTNSAARQPAIASARRVPNALSGGGVGKSKGGKSGRRRGRR